VIDPKFAAYSVECHDGEFHAGFLIKRDATEVVIRNATGIEVKVPAEKIVKLQAQQLSIMPEGLFQNLTAQEASDLIEFLSSLR
jgi:putative heme-binding domain-containing protein